jgi:hypothetical protein
MVERVRSEKDATVADSPSPTRRRRLSERQGKFAREVGSVVLGVLIALGIGEIADNLRWKYRARASTELIDAELARNAASFEERAMLQPCIERRIDELQGIVAGARRSGQLPDVGSIGRMPVRGIETAAWEEAVSSGTIVHMNSRQRSGLASMYPLIQTYNAQLDEERRLASRAQLLVDAEGAVSD